MAERLPGSMQAASRAAYNLGITTENTTQALFKAMEQGELMAEEFLPEFSNELLKAANRGGALEAAMNSTGAAIGRFRTNVFLANATFQQSGMDETVRNLFNTLSTSIQRAEPLWKLLGQTSKFVGQALEAPIELFGTLAEKLGYFTDESFKANNTFKLFMASVVLAVKPLRRIFAIFWLLPATISAVNDTIQNGLKGWDDFGVKLGLVLASAVLFRKELKSIFKLMKWFSGAKVGSTVARAGAGGAVAGMSAASPLLVSVVGFLGLSAIGGLFSLLRDVITGSNGGVSADTGMGIQSRMNNLKLNMGDDKEKFFDKTYQPMLNAQGGIGKNQLPFGPPPKVEININGGDVNQIKPKVMEAIEDMWREASISNPPTER